MQAICCIMVSFLRIKNKFLLNTNSFIKCSFKENCVLSVRNILNSKPHIAFSIYLFFVGLCDLTNLFILVQDFVAQKEFS